MMLSIKRTLKIVLGLVMVLILSAGLSMIPTLALKTNSMTELKGSWVNVYFETQEQAARDVFNLAEAKSQMLADKLGFTSKQDINIYIYDKQSTMQSKKYGLIGPMLNLKWYIGDNQGTDVLLTSPAAVIIGHNYESVRAASLHEMVHAYNSILNPNMPLWLNEGTALFLTNGFHMEDLLKRSPIPSLAQMQTSSPIKFSDMGGYDYAYTYVIYLDKTYGWEKVLNLLKTADYKESLGKSPEKIYDEWVEYLHSNYEK